jgi:hypothetical protein
MALNVRNIAVLSPISGTNSNANWTYVPGPGAVAENLNPNFNRTVKLTAQGLLVSKGGESVGFFMEDVMRAAAICNPALTWVPNFANQPSNAYIGFGNTNSTSFIVIAQDEIGTDMTYQWQYGNGTNVAAAGVYSNVTTNHLNISNTSGLIGNTYMVLVSNPTGSNTSNTATIYNDPAVVTQPANVSVTHPAPASFSATIKGQSALSYQWQFGNGSNIAAAGVYSNVTTNTLNISNSTGLNGTPYRLFFSDTGGSGNTSNGTLTVL